MTNEEVKFIKALRKDKSVYSILLKDPVLVSNELKKIYS